MENEISDMKKCITCLKEKKLSDFSYHNKQDKKLHMLRYVDDFLAFIKGESNEHIKE